MKNIKNISDFLKLEVGKTTLTTKNELLEELMYELRQNFHIQNVIQSYIQSMTNHIKRIVVTKEAIQNTKVFVDFY